PPEATSEAPETTRAPPPTPIPLRSDVTVEEFLGQAPNVPSDELGPGLRQFVRGEFDTGDVALMLAGSVSSLLMITPGLLFFYGGLLGHRNVPALMVRYLLLAALLSMMWVLGTYSLAFARNVRSHDASAGEIHPADPKDHQGNPFIGGLDHVAFRGLNSQVGADSALYPLRRPSDRISHLLFMAYQMMFFIAVPAPLVVALTDRLRASGIALFVLLWGTLVYAPLAYWVWGGGWHAAALDTGGGIPAHVGVGFAALAAAVVLGKRENCDDESPPPNRLGYLGLGAALFWGGALIQNASRAFATDGFADNAFVTTHLAACAGLIGWTGMEWLSRGKAGLTGLCAGSVAGLIAIASGSGFVAPPSSIVIGIVGGSACFCAHASVKRWFSGNGFLEVFVLHAVAGVLGVLLTGVFATASVRGYDGEGKLINGLLVGDASRLADQAFAVSSAAALALAGTLIVLLVVRVTTGFCPAERDGDGQ
ncbi:MAG: ammonium transporter, partial [Pirellulaceae bacterium]